MCPGDLCITVVIVGARNLKNISTLGKLDPYVRIIYGKDEYKHLLSRTEAALQASSFLLTVIHSLELRNVFHRIGPCFESGSVRIGAIDDL